MTRDRFGYSSDDSTGNFPPIDTKALFEAQHLAADTAVRCGSVVYDYAMALNKTWMDIWAKRVNQYMTWPQRFAECASPSQMLTTHADFVEQAVHDYQEGLQRLADVGGEAAQEMGKAIKETDKAAQTAADRAGQMGRDAMKTVKDMQKTAQSTTEQARPQH